MRHYYVHGRVHKKIIPPWKKDILYIILCISKFQDNLYNKGFSLAQKEFYEKNAQNLISKQIFARWQVVLFIFFLFWIKFIKRKIKFTPPFRISTGTMSRVNSQPPPRSKKSYAMSLPSSTMSTANSFLALSSPPKSPNPYISVITSTKESNLRMMI